MMRLQQFAVAYAQVQNEEVRLTEPSSKLDALMQILEDNPNEPIVVFSQFAQLIYLLHERLKGAKIEHGIYTGRNRTTRESDKRKFTSGSANVLIGTIGAGGVGVDGLQDVSSTVIFLDRDWSPAINNQAEDRLWRDGQRNAVQVIDIMARNTIDLGRAQRLEMKWDWIRRLLGDK
jgi:SWI/SNF-related matrix-associated actin-dependent regulator 1 of chromatin subfamily A